LAQANFFRVMSEEKKMDPGIPPRGHDLDEGLPSAAAIMSRFRVEHGNKNVRKSFCSAEFDFDGRLTEFAPNRSEGHLPIMERLVEQEALVKVVLNEEWVHFLRDLQMKRFRTSCTLLPPGGKHMRLFGRELSGGGCVGLIWDVRNLDLSDAYMWPPGYFAKTEYNVGADGSLLHGRGDNLVTMEQLREINTTLTYHSFGTEQTVTTEILPFNEVYTYMHGAEGLVGIFARTTRFQHLLHAMGVRSLISRALPAAGELPLFLHDPENGMRPFGRAAQAKLICEFSEHVKAPDEQMPHLPLDTRILKLNAEQQLEFHAQYGLTEDALDALCTTLLARDGDDPPDMQNRKSRADAARVVLLFGLHNAVEADNAASALSLVRRVAPALLDTTWEIKPTLEVRTDFAEYLRAFATRARSPNVLKAVGAAIILEELASGRALPRIAEDRRRLEDWVAVSGSVLGRLQSWQQLRGESKTSGGPQLTSFVTHHAERNRTAFYHSLLELQEYEGKHDILNGVQKLQQMVSSMHHPCLRLELLQHILGLGSCYELDTLHGAVDLARRLVDDTGNAHCRSAVSWEDLSSEKYLPKGMAPRWEVWMAACLLQGLAAQSMGNVTLIGD